MGVPLNDPFQFQWDFLLNIHKPSSYWAIPISGNHQIMCNFSTIFGMMIPNDEHISQGKPQNKQFCCNTLWPSDSRCHKGEKLVSLLASLFANVPPLYLGFWESRKILPMVGKWVNVVWKGVEQKRDDHVMNGFGMMFRWESSMLSSGPT